jgi:hypothetical protein
MITKPLMACLARQNIVLTTANNRLVICTMCHSIAYLRQVLQYLGLGIAIMTSQTIIGLRQFSHIINWSL